MSYKEFDWAKVKAEFALTTVEGSRFLPEIAPIAPSPVLTDSLERGIPWAVATGNGKSTIGGHHHSSTLGSSGNSPASSQPSLWGRVQRGCDGEFEWLL